MKNQEIGSDSVEDHTILVQPQQRHRPGHVMKKKAPSKKFRRRKIAIARASKTGIYHLWCAGLEAAAEILQKSNLAYYEEDFIKKLIRGGKRNCGVRRLLKERGMRGLAVRASSNFGRDILNILVTNKVVRRMMVKGKIVVGAENAKEVERRGLMHLIPNRFAKMR